MVTCGEHHRRALRERPGQDRRLAPWRLKSSRSCRAAGAGHFAATFNRSRPPEILKQWYAAYGRHVIPKLRQAAV